MSNKWLAVQIDIFTNPKFMELEDTFDESMGRADVLAALFSLWSHAVRHAPSGRMKVTERKLFRICDMDRFGNGNVSQGEWAEALFDIGWIDLVDDPRLNVECDADKGEFWIDIHDWSEHGGKYLKDTTAEKEQSKVRMKVYRMIVGSHPVFQEIRQRDNDRCRFCGRAVQWKTRNKSDGGTLELRDPEGEIVPDNALVCCYACRQRHNNGIGGEPMPIPESNGVLRGGNADDRVTLRGSYAVPETPVTAHDAVDRVTLRGSPEVPEHPFIVNQTPHRVTLRGVTRLQDSTVQDTTVVDDVVLRKEEKNDDNDMTVTETSQYVKTLDKHMTRLIRALSRASPDLDADWFRETLIQAEQSAGPKSLGDLLPLVNSAKSTVERLSKIPPDNKGYVANPKRYYRQVFVNVISGKS